MEDGMQLLISAESIAFFLAVFPALSISGRIIFRNYSTNNLITRVFLWLALGGLILAPIIDFLNFIGYILQLLVPSLQNLNPITVFLGVGPYLYFTTINLFLGVLVYVFAIYFVRKMSTNNKIPLITGMLLNKWETGIIILGIVGLINRAIVGIIVKFVSIYLPSLTASQNTAQGIMGFWASWLLGLVILLGTVFIFSTHITSKKD
jgi:hypothetical protein